MKKFRSERISRLSKNGLIQKLGVIDLFAIGYGDLGSSIFYALGITAFFSLGAAPISLLLAGLVFVCTALTYAEMTAALKSSGGSATFARRTFNDLVSFIAGWGLLLDFIVTIAISIFAIPPYLAFISKSLETPFFQLGFAVALIGILYLMNHFSVKHSTRISVILTLFALITQLLVVVIAFFGHLNFSEFFQHLKINAGTNWSPSWPEFWKGTAMAMVAYTGIESIASLGDEAKNPEKTLPRAIVIVMIVLVFLYLAISSVGLSLVSPQELGTKYINDPISGIVSHLPVGSRVLGPWVGLLAAALLFVAGNAGLIGASRLSFNMGEYYQLPHFFYRIHPRHKTPVVSLAFFSFLAALILIWSRGKLHFLADLYNFGAMIAFFSSHVALIVLRFKEPDLERPFRCPLNIRITSKISIPLNAILGSLATLAVWILVVVTKPEGRLLGLGWLVFGIILYVTYRYKKRIRPTAQVKIEKVKVPEYQPIQVKNILVPTKGGEETETVQMACEIAKIHGAKVTALHLIEIPFSMPLDSSLPYRELIAGAVLQRAEAIAQEFEVTMETEILRTRSVEETILRYLVEKNFDLLVLGAIKSKNAPHAGLSAMAERMLRQAHCRVFITSSF